MFLEPNVRLPSMSTPAITAAMAIARAPAASAALYPWMSASVPGMVFGVEPRPAGLPGYDVRYCAVEPGRVRSDQGICVDVRHGLEMMAGADIVVVPAWNHPETPASPALVTALRRAHQGGAKVVGLCLGAFVLGDAGLLDGRPATLQTSPTAYERAFSEQRTGTRDP